MELTIEGSHQSGKVREKIVAVCGLYIYDISKLT